MALTAEVGLDNLMRFIPKIGFKLGSGDGVGTWVAHGREDVVEEEED
jgi:hypothetical protein